MDEMSGKSQVDAELFESGPPLKWQKSVGLVKPGEPRAIRRAQLVMLIGWMPLALLAAVQFLVFDDAAAKSFFLDFSVHARYLAAAPLFILAEPDCLPRMGRIVCHFLDARLIREAELARYERAVTSTRRLLNSRVADVVIVLLAYAVVLALILKAPSAVLPAWQRSVGAGSLAFSLAGWWDKFVSLPLLLVLFLGWIWRVILWGRFLWMLARLDLRLIPSHPDHVGGLKFVSSCLRGFRLICLAMGVIVAGAAANRVMYAGASLLAFKNIIIGLVVFVLVLFAGPLTIFIRKLREAKRRGTFEYGALGAAVGQQFEQKWIGSVDAIDENALAAQDFSATTDLYQVVGNVYEMKAVPFGLKNLGELVAATLLPFVPVAFMAMPFQEILEDVVKLLL